MSVYRFISTAYDLLEVIWFSEKGKNPRTVIQSLIPDKKYRILDMCCGTFTNGFSIAQKNINNIWDLCFMSAPHGCVQIY